MSVESRLKALEDLVQTLQTELATVNTELSDAKTQINAVLANYAELTARHERLQASVAEEFTRINTATETEFSRVQEAIGTIQNQGETLVDAAKNLLVTGIPVRWVGAAPAGAAPEETATSQAPTTRRPVSEGTSLNFGPAAKTRPPPAARTRGQNELEWK